MVNAALLEDTIAHIRGNPELHNQDFYYEMTEFGVGACFAGRILLMAGYTPVMTHGDTGCMAERPGDGKFVGVWSEAVKLLDLDERWAINLFSPKNTAKMLELKVKDLLNGSPLDRYDELISHGS